MRSIGFVARAAVDLCEPAGEIASERAALRDGLVDRCRVGRVFVELGARGRREADRVAFRDDFTRDPDEGRRTTRYRAAARDTGGVGRGRAVRRGATVQQAGSLRSLQLSAFS